MGTISNGESGLSVRNKLNDVIDKIEGTTDIGNNILFGDNSKAIFGGATSELQIYSDGTHSRISDQGTGNLIINAGEFRVNTANDAEAIIKGNTSGDVELYYAGGQKLATTSTGIDVTGTITADGLTVEKSISSVIASASGTVGRFINNANSSDAAIVDIVGGNTSVTSGEAISALYLSDANANGRGRVQYNHQNDNLELYSAAVPRLNIANNGDISFYEDTGTTAKFFWDASAESLGIGLTPSAWRSTEKVIQLPDGAFYTGNNYVAMGQNYYIPSEGGAIYIESDFASDYYQLGGTHVWRRAASGTAGTSVTWSESMRIDSSGDLTVKGGRIFINESDNGNTAIGLTRDADEGYVQVYSAGVITSSIRGNGDSYFNGGNVGIGTDSPSTKVEISGAGFQTLSVTSTNSSPVLKLNSAASSVAYLQWNNAGSSPLSFYDLTASTERMRIDSSGNVGIGTTNPVAQFAVGGAGRRIEIAGTDGVIRGYDRTSSWANIDFEAAGYTFDVSGTEAMHIDSSGRVGIGGVPNTNWRNDIADQEVLMLGTEATLYSDAGVTTALINNALINNDDTFVNISQRGASQYFQYEGAHKWYTAASASAGSNITTEMTSPKMTLDVSGNLLVGTDALTPGNGNTDTGHLLKNDGRFFASSASNSQFNRNSDGDILTFRKSGVLVGTIGTSNSDFYFDSTDDLLLQANGNVGVGIFQSGGSLQNVSVYADLLPTGSLDLGSSGAKWVNLHLSGGVVFGTGGPSPITSNTLDDYEEGSYDVSIVMDSGTVTLASNYNGMKYIKIGRMVTVQGQIRVESVSNPSGLMKISLPFAIDQTSDEGRNISGCVPRLYQASVPSGGLYPYLTTVFNLGAYAQLEWVRNNATTINHVPAADEYYIINFNYFTA